MSINIRQILLTTREELEKHRGEWPEIAQRARVSYSWLVKVAAGRTENPCINELQRLVNVLIKRQKRVQ